MNIFILIRLTQNNTTNSTMFTFSDKGDKLRVVISVSPEHILYPCCLAIYYNSFITYNSLCTIHNVHSQSTVHNIHKLVKYWYKWDVNMNYQHINETKTLIHTLGIQYLVWLTLMLKEVNKNPNISWTVNQEGVTNDWQSIFCKYNEWSICPIFSPALQDVLMYNLQHLHLPYHVKNAINLQKIKLCTSKTCL